MTTALAFSRKCAMNRRNFAQLLAMSGVAPLGRFERALGIHITAISALTSDSAPSTPVPPLKPGRRIEGASAVLLPFTVRDEIDWGSFGGLLERTWAATLTPAVNMDTGYVNLLTPAERGRVLAYTRDHSQGRRFIAGHSSKATSGILPRRTSLRWTQFVRTAERQSSFNALRLRGKARTGFLRCTGKSGKRGGRCSPSS